MTETFSIAPVSTKSMIVVLPLLLIILLAAGRSPALIFPLGFLGLVTILIFGFPVYSSRKVGIQADRQQLNIRGELYGRNINLTSLKLDVAKIVNLDESRDLRPRWRTNGMGLPGYKTGWFKLVDGENALLFVTDSTSVVYIPTGEGYSLLISVADAPRFLASLKKQAQAV